MARASTFTSYINSELPTNVDSNFNRLEAVATRTYSNIAKQAEAASRAAAGLVGGRGTGGIGGGLGSGQARGLQQQAAAARAVADVNGRVSTSSRRAAVDVAAQGAAAERAARQNSGLVTNLRALSTSLNVVQGPLGPLAGRISALGSAVTELTGFRLGLAGVASSLFVIGSVGERYSQVSGQVAAAFENQNDYNRSLNDVAGIANRARVGLEAVTGLYIRLSQSAEQAGITQERAGRIAEVAAKAATLSGGTQQGREAALVQFTQAFGANFKGGGQELQSILEGANQLGVAIADGLGVPIGELKRLGEEGKLNSAVVAQALENSADRIEARFQRMPVTMKQASSEFVNNLTIMVGGLDKAIGFTSTLAGVISGAANSLQFLASAAVGAGVGFASIKLGGLITEMATSIRQQQVMGGAIKELGVRRQAAAVASLGQHTREVAALEAEQQQIRESIALRERERIAAQRDFARAQPGRNAGDLGSTRRMADAAAAESQAVRQLTGDKQRLGIINNALVAANGRVVDSQQRVATATERVAATSGRLRGVIGNLVGAFNFYGIAAAAVTTALIYLITKSEQTETVLASMGNTSIETARKALQLAGANRDLAQSYREIAVAAAQKDLSENRTKYQDVRGEFSSRLKQVAGNPKLRLDFLGTGRQSSADLLKLAGDIDAGRIRVADALGKVRKIFQQNPGAFGSEQGKFINTPGLLGTRYQDFRDNAIAAFETGSNYRQSFNDAKQVQTEVGQQTAVVLGGGKPATAKVGDLRTQAQVAALDSGTSALKAAGIRRKDAYRLLEESLGVKGGKVDAAKAEDYKTRAADIERAYSSEVAGIKAAAGARSASNAGARREAAIQKADAREGIQNRLQQGMLALEQKRPTLSVVEYNAERVKLLETYDREINAIDQLAAHSSRATAQMVADTRQMIEGAARSGEKRRDVLGQWADQPKAVTRARDQIDDLNRLVGTFVDGVAQITDDNPLGRGLYTQEIADADAARIEQGVRRPMQDAIDQHQQFVELASLRLGGYDAEAAALERALQIQNDIGEVTRDDFQTLVDQERQQLAINDVLESRGRLVGAIQGTVQQSRDAFEALLTDLPERGPAAVGDFFKSIQANVRGLLAKRITEQLFAGADSKVRQLIGGQNGVEQAYQFLAARSASSGTALERVAAAADSAANALNNLAAGPVSDVGEGLEQVVGGTPGSAVASAAAVAKNAAQAAEEAGDIVVTARRTEAQRLAGNAGSNLPTGSKTYSTIFEGFGDKLDKVFGTKFLKGVGGAVGGALQGAGEGQMAAGVASLLGIKTNATGAGIGGAIGSFLPIPGGSFIGGAIGGILGGLLEKKKYGTSSLSLNAYGELSGAAGTGNDAGARAGATGAAKSVADGITAITQALGATVTGLPALSIGSYKDQARVSTTGYQGTLGGQKDSTQAKLGIIDFGKGGEQAAIEFAIRYTIEKAVISGISDASRNIIKSGQDLQLAIQKAVAIESIPKRLLAKTDPVRSAVTVLNDEFQRLINYLKEGGATAAQFADAQKLYDLERADAIKQATGSTVEALDQFMKDMIGGSNSPLNKRTVYANAQNDLQALATQVNAGKLVDQNELLTAVRNFQEGSRALNGSSQAFFTDFQMLYDLLGKAKSNVGLGSTVSLTPLPASPFESDATVQAMLQKSGQDQVNAVNNQTGVLGAKLDNIAEALGRLGFGQMAGEGGSSLDYLPMNYS